MRREARSNKDWKQQAKVIFNEPKPAHFVDHRHCCECAEHDETLTTFDVDSIDLQQLGNPGWDPLCFSSSEGLIYYGLFKTLLRCGAQLFRKLDTMLQISFHAWRQCQTLIEIPLRVGILALQQ